MLRSECVFRLLGLMVSPPLLSLRLASPLVGVSDGRLGEDPAVLNSFNNAHVICMICACVKKQ